MVQKALKLRRKSVANSGKNLPDSAKSCQNEAKKWQKTGVSGARILIDFPVFGSESRPNCGLLKGWVGPPKSNWAIDCVAPLGDGLPPRSQREIGCVI